MNNIDISIIYVYIIYRYIIYIYVSYIYIYIFFFIIYIYISYMYIHVFIVLYHDHTPTESFPERVDKFDTLETLIPDSKQTATWPCQGPSCTTVPVPFRRMAVQP